MSGAGFESWKILERRSFEPGEAPLVCVANQKGGVAKTTTCLNLGAALALRGRRVLVVDIDPQANATSGLGIDHRRVARSTYELLMGEAKLEDVVVRTRIAGLSLAPGSLDLAGAEIELVGSEGRERRLADALKGFQGAHDIVFVDCPPSLGLLTINALAAAPALLVPVQCEYYALEGLGQLLATAERARRSLNPGLRVAGFLLTMHDARTKLSVQVAEDVRAHFGELVFETVIPRSVRLSEAPSFGEPAVSFDAAGPGASAYRRLAAEVEARFALAARAHTDAESDARKATKEELAPAGATPRRATRGYGAIAPEPPGLDESWPRPDPFRRSP